MNKIVLISALVAICSTVLVDCGERVERKGSKIVILVFFNLSYFRVSSLSDE